jgi:hypothetical protein
MSYQSLRPDEHPLVRELQLMARRADDLQLKERYDTLRRTVVSAIHRKQPGLVARLVRDEIERLAEIVLTECRQWREAGAWPDHRRHCQTIRAAAQVHLYLSQTGIRLAGEE